MGKKPDIQAIDRIVKEEGLTRAQRRLLHDENRKQPGLSLDELRELAREIKRLYPHK
jgi:hypothetical protein